MRSFAYLIIVAAACLLTAMPAFAASSATIVKSISARIDAEPKLGGHDVHIAVRDGNVRLSGAVTNAADRERIVALARGVEGVRRVDDELHLRADEVVDPSSLAQAILSQIKEDPALRGYRVRVSVSGGTALLAGETETREQARRMNEIARTTPGIAAVDDRLTIAPAVSDSEISRGVREILARDMPETERLLAVDTHDGVVTLSGTVANHRVADAALSAALMAPGVRDIHSDIRYGAAAPRR